MQETLVRSLSQEDSLKEEMAPHSSILAWEIPWTEEPDRLQSMGSQSWTRLSDFTSLYRYSKPDFSIDDLVMSMCRVVSCVVGKGCLLWTVCSLDKTLLAFALLPFVLQGQTCLLIQVFLDFLLLHSNPLWWKGYLFMVVVLEGLIGLHRTTPLLLLQHCWLGHRLRWPW